MNQRAGPRSGRGSGTAPPPFLVVNPRAGPPAGVEPEALVAAAAKRGIECRLLAPRDVGADLARKAAARGAPSLGIAGGDGSLAGVAAVALERDLPFVPVPYGTRNHFARDVGFDPGDPVGALAAFAGERERRVDVGAVAERIFLNNVSLGLYASFVHDPERRTKNRLVAFARMFKAALGPTRRPLDLRFEVDGRTERHLALVCLVAANDYDIRSISDLRTRERLDDGWLHAYVIEATTPFRLVTLLGRAAIGRVAGADGWAEYTSRTFSLESRRRRIHAALDGEPVVLPPRLEFEVRPRALRVLLPPATGDGEHDASAGPTR